MSGSAHNVVQSRDVFGGVHIHHAIGQELPTPRQLPADVVHFIDREANIARLDAWLDSPPEGVPTVKVISGTGGVGKTSLAAHWAHRVRGRFPDGDLYLDLRGFHEERSLTAEEALDRLLRAFDIPVERIPAGADAQAALYRSLLHARQILIFLDNAATVDQVRALLPGTPTCRVLVTSRSQMAGLTAREGAERMPLDTLSPESAVDLLRQIADADRVDGDPVAAAEVARYCGYLPLPLRIVTERLIASPYLSMADLAEELAQSRERLDVLATDEDQFSTVRAVFSWSYQALPPDTARMFRLLGLPNGPDTGVAAAAALAGVSTGAARRLLHGLVGIHLLEEYRQQRFRFHDLLRVYAAECVENDESADGRRAALRRLITWYARSAKAAAEVFAPHFSSIPIELDTSTGELPRFTDRAAALAWCDDERANLVAAVGQAAEAGEHDLAWQLPVALFGYFLVRRTASDFVTTHRTGIASARSLGNRLAEAWLLTSVAIAYEDLRQYDTAAEHLRRALDAWRQTGGPRWCEAWTLRQLGSIYRALGRQDEAMPLLDRALAMHIEEGDAWGEATTLGGLALARYDLGEFDAALRHLEQAMAIRREMGDRRNIGKVLSDFGLVYGGMGRTDAAVEHLEQALEVHVELDYWHGEAVAHERLGDVLDQAGRTEQAHEHWQAAVLLYEKLGDVSAEDIRARLTA
jgi:tetratricopeptide (TPR) repeat protein